MCLFTPANIWQKDKWCYSLSFSATTRKISGYNKVQLQLSSEKNHSREAFHTGENAQQRRNEEQLPLPEQCSWNTGCGLDEVHHPTPLMLPPPTHKTESCSSSEIFSKGFSDSDFRIRLMACLPLSLNHRGVLKNKHQHSGCQQHQSFCSASQCDQLKKYFLHNTLYKQACLTSTDNKHAQYEPAECEWGNFCFWLSYKPVSGCVIMTIY